MQIDIPVNELTKEEVAQLPPNTQVLLFNGLFETYHIKRINKSFLKRLKNYNKYIHYYTFK